MTTPPFNPTDVVLAWPEVLLTLVGLLVLCLECLVPEERRGWLGGLSLLGVAGAAALVFGQVGERISGFSGMYVVDPFAVFLKVVFLAATAMTILLALPYLRLERIERGEFYALVLFCTVGMMLMASGGDLLSLWLGLETMSICIYVLVGFLKGDQRSNEAALKYLLMGAFSSAVLLYGIVLLFGVAGSTNLAAIGQALGAGRLHGPMLILAVILLTAGLGFKIAAVPFHAYIPDVYEGAPTAVTAFISVGPKVAGFAMLVRIFLLAIPPEAVSWSALFYVLAILTMTLGNLAAIAQRNVKRMLAYSSIAHVGYLLIGVVAGGALGTAALLLYVLAYCFMNLGAFATVILLCRETVKGDQLEDFSGLAQASPAAAAAMLVFLLSLAGVPPTGGFVGKLYLFGAAIEAQYLGLAVIAVINSAISLFYYMRVAMFMYMRELPPGGLVLSRSRPLHLALLAAAVGTLLMGVYPGPFVDFALASVVGVVK
jgi:NADH-quinone oxidoreductase subunit N